MREPFAKYVEKNLKPGFLLIACGLPGTWKTETTEEVSKIKSCKLLRTDIIRLEVLKNEDIFDSKVAGNMNKRTQVYDEMFRQADEALGGSSCSAVGAARPHPAGKWATRRSRPARTHPAGQARGRRGRR